MTREEIIERLRNDDDYYGDFGKQFLSNSHISRIFDDPDTIHDPYKPNTNFVKGSYFHVSILEPHKLESFNIVDATNRNTKKYKEAANGDILLLRKEADNLDKMQAKLMDNDVTRDLIKGVLVDYERPGLVELNGLTWKGKADILNHDEKLIIDLKTTGAIDRFPESARKFNYDSQAYIYKEMFGYEMVFVVADKKTHEIGIYDCSEEFYESGKAKVDRACEIYKDHFGINETDYEDHIISMTL